MKRPTQANVSGPIRLQTTMSPKGGTLLAMAPEATCKSRARHPVPEHVHFIRGRPVYEYPLNGQWIMLDMDDGYVLWTGIWKGKHSP